MKPLTSADPMPARTEFLSARPDPSGISVPARAETIVHAKTNTAAQSCLQLRNASNFLWKMRRGGGFTDSAKCRKSTCS